MATGQARCAHCRLFGSARPHRLAQANGPVEPMSQRDRTLCGQARTETSASRLRDTSGSGTAGTGQDARPRDDSRHGCRLPSEQVGRRGGPGKYWGGERQRMIRLCLRGTWHERLESRGHHPSPAQSEPWPPRHDGQRADDREVVIELMGVWDHDTGVYAGAEASAGAQCVVCARMESLTCRDPERAFALRRRISRIIAANRITTQ